MVIMSPIMVVLIPNCFIVSFVMFGRVNSVIMRLMWKESAYVAVTSSGMPAVMTVKSTLKC